jgi:NAD(P)H-hydrate epimerase
MQLVITPDESARLDRESTVPVDVLMERAGLGVALAVVGLGAGYGSRVAVLAGKGNNGGDGYVAARYLARRGCSVGVYALGAPKPDTAAGRAAAKATAEGVGVAELGDPMPAEFIVDALFGVGFRGSLPEPVVPWTQHESPVVAVDLPSGLDAMSGVVSGEAITAAATVTFHALKPGHLLGEGPERCGTTTVVDIGLEGGEPELLVCEEEDAPRPARPRRTHKWAAGSVAVVGGSPGITGAPLLAATAALAMGAGSVALICPRALQPTYAAGSAEIMTRGIGKAARFSVEDVPDVLDEARRFDVLVLGPGLGPGQEGFVAGVVAGWEGKLIVDADGLNALDGPGLLADRTAPTIITPHAGEFQRLTGEEADYRAAAALPDAAGVLVVLKGNPTFVLGRERWVVRSGGPELASIGTGDVLAGMTGALWARGLDGDATGRSAAYWHGRAGADLATGGSVTAEALAAYVGRYAF